MIPALVELEKRYARGQVTDEDKALLREYILELQAERNLTPDGLKVELRNVIAWLPALPTPFTKMTTADIYTAKMVMDGKGYKQNTLRVYLFKFLRFARWVQRNKGNDIDLDKLDRIRKPPADKETKTAAGMLTTPEIRRMLDVCRSPRDKAVYAILYEGGLRPIEVVRLKWGDVKFDKYGVIITTSQKTGNPRYIRLIASTEYLARWKSMTPGGTFADDPVFVTVYPPYRPISHGLLHQQVKKLAKRAGIEKHVSLYLFRHSRVTHMIEAEIPESVIKLQHWGTLRTNMLGTYAHVTGQHVDEVLLDRAGVKISKRKKERDAMAPCQCERCQYVNPPSAQFCSACGTPLTEEAVSIEEKVRAPMADPDTLIEYGSWVKRQ